MDGRRGIEAAKSSEVIRLAIAYNDALDRRTQTGGSNTDEVMEFFADDAVRIVVGSDDHSPTKPRLEKPRFGTASYVALHGSSR